jgi:Cdc6-like AAA superfamily ATPase
VGKYSFAMPEKEIFIGRKEEIQLFREHFEKQFLPKKSFLEKIKTKNTEKTNEFAKIFFLYGDAGFGKSTLANEMTSEAKLISKGKEEELKIIKLDWDSLGRIDSFRQALDFIYAELIKDKYKIRKYFEDYGEALDKIRDIQKKIESKQENSDWTNNIGEISAKGIQVAAGYIPTFGDTAQKVLETKAVENLTKVTINYAVGAGAEKYQEWVRKNNILKPDEYLLWKNSEAQLAGILADGLKEASKENIILFGIDTYEIIDHFDEDFRNSFLKRF